MRGREQINTAGLFPLGKKRPTNCKLFKAPPSPYLGGPPRVFLCKVTALGQHPALATPERAHWRSLPFHPRVLQVQRPSVIRPAWEKTRPLTEDSGLGA